MASSRHGQDSLAYRPTSLDFINRPNPVEPHAGQVKHPLNSTPRLEAKTSNQGLLRLLLDQNVSPRPAKRRKSGDISRLPDLPKLPAVQSGAKRLRIPPTLSGLHQPPPNAGLLPSMSVEQPLDLTGKGAHSKPEAVAGPKTPNEESNAKISCVQSDSAGSKRKHRKWLDEETSSLLKGVARFGIGSWTKILNCPDYHFQSRSAVDLKDRFRVCCPDAYATGRKVKKSQNPQDTAAATVALSQRLNVASVDVEPIQKGKRSHQVSSTQLQELGIEEPFEKSQRRRRTVYSKAEDEALLRGFIQHGNSWAAIRKQEPRLRDRTATDLRDRFRTRYPDEYANAGLVPRPDAFPKKPLDSMHDVNGAVKGKPDDGSTAMTTAQVAATSKDTEYKEPVQSIPAKKQPPTSLLHVDDVFWGALFDVEDNESERITLDRRILDWPHDIFKPSATTASTDIDPLATFNLPRPTASATTAADTGALISMGTTNAQHLNSTAAALPSVAAITANAVQDDFVDQRELPSLLGAFGAFEGDSRTGGHLMSLDELLS